MSVRTGGKIIASDNRELPNQSGNSGKFLKSDGVNASWQNVTASDAGALPSSTKYGASFVLSMNSSTFVLTATLKDQDGNTLGSAQTIDLPLESVVVSGSYDSVNKQIVLVLQNGSELDIPVGDLISGLQTEITIDNKLSADLVDDTTSTNKFVTASDKTNWDGKANKSGDTFTGEIIMAYDNAVSFRNSNASARHSIKPVGQNVLRVGSNYNANIAYDWDCTTGDLYPKTDNVGSLGTSSYKWSNLYINTAVYTPKINNGADITVPASGGTMALISDIISSLSGLSDVSITSPSAGEHLVFNDVTQKWENTASTASISWGDVTGDISNQTDLKDALDAKADETNTVNGAPLSTNKIIFYGTSSTAGLTAEKKVSISSITTLETGTIIFVKPDMTATTAGISLKLNDFTAYPIRYNGNAITTDTDSIVWNQAYISIFVFTGAHWDFAGHGFDKDTTYSTMTVADGIAGTATSARTMRADYVKQIIQGTTLTGIDVSTTGAVVATDSITSAIGKLQATKVSATYDGVNERLVIA